MGVVITPAYNQKMYTYVLSIAKEKWMTWTYGEIYFQDLMVLWLQEVISCWICCVLQDWSIESVPVIDKTSSYWLTNLCDHVHCFDLHKMGQACNLTYERLNCTALKEVRKSTNYYGTLALKSESVSLKVWRNKEAV